MALPSNDCSLEHQRSVMPNAKREVAFAALCFACSCIDFMAVILSRSRSSVKPLLGWV